MANCDNPMDVLWDHPIVNPIVNPIQTFHGIHKAFHGTFHKTFHGTSHGNLVPMGRPMGCTTGIQKVCQYMYAIRITFELRTLVGQPVKSNLSAAVVWSCSTV